MCLWGKGSFQPNGFFFLFIRVVIFFSFLEAAVYISLNLWALYQFGNLLGGGRWAFGVRWSRAINGLVIRTTVLRSRVQSPSKDTTWWKRVWWKQMCLVSLALSFPNIPLLILPNGPTSWQPLGFVMTSLIGAVCLIIPLPSWWATYVWLML